MIKLLIVEDSETEFKILEGIFSKSSDIEVVGHAKNGNEAIELAQKLQPDIITMDILMPYLNGIEATRQIMSSHPVPIVIISSHLHNKELQASYRALEAGALTVIDKPVPISHPDFEYECKYLIDTIRSMSQIRVIKRRDFKVAKEDPFVPIQTELSQQKYEIVVIGASVGGPQALKDLFYSLPIDYPLPFVVVQHMAQGYIEGYSQWLDENVLLKVKLAENLEYLEPGTIYLAPDNIQCEIKRSNKGLYASLASCSQGENFCPSINVLFKSIAETSGKRAVGLLLTGMGSDGAEGLKKMKEKGAHTLIQNEESSVVFGMAKVAQSMGIIDKELSLQELPSYLTHSVLGITNNKK